MTNGISSHRSDAVVGSHCLSGTGAAVNRYLSQPTLLWVFESVCGFLLVVVVIAVVKANCEIWESEQILLRFVIPPSQRSCAMVVARWGGAGCAGFCYDIYENTNTSQSIILNTFETET